MSNYVVVNVPQCSLLHGYAIYDIFVADIVGYNLVLPPKWNPAYATAGDILCSSLGAPANWSQLLLIIADLLRISVSVAYTVYTIFVSSCWILCVLVHGHVTIIFVVSVGLSVCLSVCLFVCLCRVFLSRL